MDIYRPDFMSDTMYSAIQDEMRSQEIEREIRSKPMWRYDYERLGRLYEGNSDRIDELRYSSIEEILLFEKYARAGDKQKVGFLTQWSNASNKPSITGIRDVFNHIGFDGRTVTKNGETSIGAGSVNSNIDYQNILQMDGAVAFVRFVREDPEGYRDYVRASYEGRDIRLFLESGGDGTEVRDLHFDPVLKGKRGLPDDFVVSAFNEGFDYLRNIRDLAENYYKSSGSSCLSYYFFIERFNLFSRGICKYMTLQEEVLGIKRVSTELDRIGQRMIEGLDACIAGLRGEN